MCVYSSNKKLNFGIVSTVRCEKIFLNIIIKVRERILD